MIFKIILFILKIFILGTIFWKIIGGFALADLPFLL